MIPLPHLMEKICGITKNNQLSMVADTKQKKSGSRETTPALYIRYLGKFCDSFQLMGVVRIVSGFNDIIKFPDTFTFRLYESVNLFLLQSAFP